MSAFMADAVERPSVEAKRALLAKLSARFANRFSTGTALREQHANTHQMRASRHSGLRRVDARGDRGGKAVCRGARAGDPFRHWHIARRSGQAPFGGVSLD